MSAEFIPLLAPKKNDLTGNAAGSSGTAFQSLQPKPISPSQDSQRSTDQPQSAIVAKPKACSERRAQPSIECDRDGERVTRILITCGCGESIELECAYTSPTPEAHDQRAPDGI